MRTAFDPFSFLVTSIAGWMNQHQHHVINYLIEENRVLREQIGNRRLRFSDDQRRRLAVKGKKLGRKILAQVATVVAPETLLAWHRKLIANKYDGSAQRSVGRPRTAADIAASCDTAWRTELVLNGSKASVVVVCLVPVLVLNSSPAGRHSRRSPFGWACSFLPRSPFGPE